MIEFSVEAMNAYPYLLNRHGQVAFLYSDKGTLQLNFWGLEGDGKPHLRMDATLCQMVWCHDDPEEIVRTAKKKYPHETFRLDTSLKIKWLNPGAIVCVTKEVHGENVNVAVGGNAELTGIKDDVLNFSDLKDGTYYQVPSGRSSGPGISFLYGKITPAMQKENTMSTLRRDLITIQSEDLLTRFVLGALISIAKTIYQFFKEGKYTSAKFSYEYVVEHLGMTSEEEPTSEDFFFGDPELDLFNIEFNIPSKRACYNIILQKGKFLRYRLMQDNFKEGESFNGLHFDEI